MRCSKSVAYGKETNEKIHFQQIYYMIKRRSNKQNTQVKGKNKLTLTLSTRLPFRTCSTAASRVAR